jgi:hypothetical protein
MNDQVCYYNRYNKITDEKNCPKIKRVFDKGDPYERQNDKMVNQWSSNKCDYDDYRLLFVDESGTATGHKQLFSTGTERHSKRTGHQLPSRQSTFEPWICRVFFHATRSRREEAAGFH